MQESAKITSIEVRLELVKLTYTHARDVDEAVERAKVLEQYIAAGEPVRETTRPRPPTGLGRASERKKKVDKPAE